MTVDELATQIMVLDWKARKDWTVEEQADRYGELQEMLTAYEAAKTAEGAVAWRAVAHPETGMGAMIHPIKRFLIQDADGIYGEGKWELQALVVRSSAADTAYNVSEAHMFGPPVDPVHPPAEARALAAEAASLAKDERIREAHAFIAKLVRMQSGAGWTRAVVRDAAAEFLRSQGVAVEPGADTTPEMVARALTPETADAGHE